MKRYNSSDRDPIINKIKGIIELMAVEVRC